MNAPTAESGGAEPSGAEPSGATPGGPRVRFRVGESEVGFRLDAALAGLAGVARSQARRWIDTGLVHLEGQPARASARVSVGQTIEAQPPEPSPSDLAAEPIPLDVLHEDSDLIVVNKQAGLVVHPAPGHPSGTLVNALLHHCGDLAGIGGVLRPGIVHRLDKGTSGVMVVAKNDDTHAALASQFHDHDVERVYLAIVRGVPGPDTGREDRPIGRHPRDRKRMSVATGSGRAAQTAWRVRERFHGADHALLEVRPETGRTHQIRVHLASAGLPIAGDPVYGRSKPGRRAGVPLGLDRPALHAAVLGFRHPGSGVVVRFETEPPPDFAAAIERLRAPR